MDQLNTHIEEITAAVEADGLDSVPGAAALGAAMITHAPVLAEVLLSTSEPVVARERAFGRIVGVVQGLTAVERDRIESALTFAEIGVLDITVDRRVAV